MAETLIEAFEAAVRAHGPRTALIEGDGNKVSFGDLKARADGIAAHLASRGVRPGDRLLLAMPVGADLYASLAAIWALGAVAVLPEPAMGLNGVRHAVRQTDVRGLCATGFYRLLRLLIPGLWARPVFDPARVADRMDMPLPQSVPDDIALISFTSGTTGLPKAIPRSHRFLMAQHAAVAPILASDDHEVDLVAFPVFALLNLAEGRTTVLPNWRMSRPDRVTPNALRDWIGHTGVTRLLLPPALCDTLSRASAVPEVRTLFTGGGPVFPDLLARLRSYAPSLKITAVYGSTEAEPIAAVNLSSISPEDEASMTNGLGLLAGLPVPEVSLRISEGEIQVSGAHVNAGYLDPGDDAETKLREGGVTWHRTGDAGVLDDLGRLWLLGRHGAAVPSGGRMLYPFALEAAARSWPGVRQAALVRIGGQAVLAIEGDRAEHRVWAENAGALGVDDLQILRRIPMDRRHRSKVDTQALVRSLNG
ncbi:MAG: AMP-binding protein [Pseudomonadota bacterium]